MKIFDLAEFRRRFIQRPSLRFQTGRIWRAARLRRGPEAPTAVLIGFSRWKTFILDFLPEYNVVLQDLGAASLEDLEAAFSAPRPHAFAWSYNFPPDLALFCARRGIPLTYVEDGFLRSQGLGAARTTPASLVFDDRAMHFDRLRP